MVRRNVPFEAGVSIGVIQAGANENSILSDCAICDYSDRLLGRVTAYWIGEDQVRGLLRCGISTRLMSPRGQNPNPSLALARPVPPDADIRRKRWGEPPYPLTGTG